MNKTCARCQKVVYPIEELKCLDKTWHKTCFRCTECGMTLNMKTYKGYNKMPYCEAHIPKAKATAIADTPELKRIAENTKIQSNVKYHADFEKAKGKFTQVADDPETLRIKQNTKHISNVAYHGDLEKKAAMEKQRGSAEVSDSSTQSQQQPQQQQPQQQQQQVNPYNEMRSAILQNSHHPSGNAVDQVAQVHPQVQQQQHNPTPVAAVASGSHHSHLNNNPSNGSVNSYHSVNSNNNGSQQMQMRRSVASASVYDGSSNSNNSDISQQQQQQLQQMRSKHSGTAVGGGAAGGSGSGSAIQQLYASPNYQSVTPSENALNVVNGHVSNHQQKMMPVGSSNIGKIADYDPLTDGPRGVPGTGRSTTTLVYSSDPQQQQQQQQRGGNSVYPKRIGSVTDIDPANGIYGSLSGAEQAHAQKHQQYYAQVQKMQQQEQQLQLQQQQIQQQQMRQQPSYESSMQANQSRQTTATNSRLYKAIYDYEAQDVDEVSFREGDIIYEVESIDSGWMTGRVERTGKTGMLPANYVEHAVI
ncbi:LIM and SH3 domain protein Lasp isoform X3 [Drosophila subobscura]|uniref:LIM and SH3 domain protein Lasp isoform X3 n=1 Tax=Drosophila subobscura TaxID=7241 RepID=UPI00155B0A55|nr:LIM and SH3 domain protein Lasp isoform X3 [Drosophila subobscura]